ncbi:kinetochore-associated protein DSN1 homolog [Cynoglossus semilaevis]|uniref:kinetochore-associated protein DSN1 homolog n=1 Tax=Cynoglossus semilaevis TaxID=244447 RepID=UPI000495A58F|nr:uncharacterized protein LOC103392872 [Cynoglossus semilaevis]
MEEIRLEANGCSQGVANEVNQNEVNTVASKRCSTSSTASVGTGTPPKSLRLEPPLSSAQTPDTEEANTDADTEKQLINMENTDGPSVPDHPAALGKSWRRATLTRRSLPALPNPYRVLCRSISASLSEQERLEKLMEASMRLALDRAQNSLQRVSNTSLECFQKQVKHMEKEWSYLAKSIRSEAQSHQSSTETISCEPAVQKATEKIQKAINRLQAESVTWESLLNKHRCKAEELKRKVEEGQEGGIFLDSTCVTQSSQHLFIQSKPDYYNLLRRQEPKLHTVALIMDTQCKIVRELLSVKKQSELLVKETSRRLVAEAGLQDLSPDSLKNLMLVPSSFATL